MLLIQGPQKNHWPDQWFGISGVNAQVRADTQRHVSRKSFCMTSSCPDGCWFPQHPVVTSSQPSCNEPLPPHHLGGNAHQVFPFTPGHRGCLVQARRRPCYTLRPAKGVAGKPGGWGWGRMRSRAKIKLILAER